MTIITAVSDLHGHLPVIPDTDLLLIAGDICPDFHGPAAGQNGAAGQSFWLATDFLPWLIDLRERGIVVVGVAGNHDWIFQYNRNAADILPWIYLEDESIELGGLKIHGTPWQPEFCNWAFNATEDFMAEKFSLIPEDTDILISHGPPSGILDSVGRRSIGSTSLNRACQRVMPTLTVFGHRHSPGVEQVEGCVFANVTVVDETYNMVYPPTSFEL